ncbi:MAG: hypothetical protein ACNA8S_09935 [Deferrisomatales bacterium]
MKRFERFRRQARLSIDQAAALWAEKVRSPEELLSRAGRPGGRAALQGCLKVDGRRLRDVEATAEAFCQWGTGPASLSHPPVGELHRDPGCRTGGEDG